MERHRTATAYLWVVSAVGVGLLLLATAIQAPSDLGRNGAQLLLDAGILLALVFLSSISPLQTRVGSVVTVNMAPLFGAVLVLPPWAVMLVAALGTLDERIPGRTIPWPRFLFNRGMFVITYGLPSLLIYPTGVTNGHVLTLSNVPILLFAVLAIVVLNVGQTSLAVSLLQEIPLMTTARRMVAGRMYTYITLPLVGVLIAVLLKSSDAGHIVVFLLYGPLLVYRASLNKQNQLDRWLRDSFIMQSRIVDMRDGQTFGHSQRVGDLSEAVARALRLSDEACNTIRVAGILHDLGKIAIPDSILLKPAKLTPEEYEIIKTHPVQGANILAEHPEQKGVAAIVMHHHEKWNGSGYPDGLAGEEIPIGSRIVDVCDAFDTITQARVFRPTVKTEQEAIEEIRRLGGSWYDPQVTAALEIVIADRLKTRLGAPLKKDPPKKSSSLEVLAFQGFRRLWIGQAVSYFGDTMNVTGLAIMLFVITHSASAVAAGLVAKAVPTVLFGLVAGPLIDRFNRQRLMIAADLFRAVLTLTIPFFAYAWMPGALGAVFLVATASSLFNPAKQAILPTLVPDNLLVRANGLISSSEKAMELLGYSAAGIIAATLSWVPLFLIDAGTYLFSAVTLLGIADRRKIVGQRRLHLGRDIVDGARFILNSGVLRSTLGLTFMVVLFVGMTLPVLVVLSYRSLHAGALGYGLLEAGIGAGSIVGALSVVGIVSKRPAGLIILLGVAGMGVAEVLVGFSASLWIALVFLAVGGFLNMLYYVPLISVIQSQAPDQIRGRVMSTRFIIVQLAVLAGMALAGPLTDRLGAPLIYITSGGLLLSAAMVGLAFRNLREAAIVEDAGHPAKAAAAQA